MSERSHSRTPPADRKPARGIRAGKSARRKREAYLRYQEGQGYSVPVLQSRPLYTSSFWEPESDQSDSEVEVTADRIVVPDSDALQGALETAGAASSSSSSLTAPVPKFLAPTSKAFPKPPPLVAPASSSSRPRPSVAPRETVRRVADLHQLIELYIPNQWDRRRVSESSPCPW